MEGGQSAERGQPQESKNRERFLAKFGMKTLLLARLKNDNKRNLEVFESSFISYADAGIRGYFQLRP